MSTPEQNTAETPVDTRPAIRFLGDMQRIVPNAGDVFVIRCDTMIPADAEKHIQYAFHQVLPGARCIVLSKGMTLECIAAQSAALELDKMAAKAKSAYGLDH